MDPADVALPSLAVGAVLAMVVGWNGVVQGNEVRNTNFGAWTGCVFDRTTHSPDIHYD